MTLTWALVLLAGLILVGIVVHGAWTARRAAPRRAAWAEVEAVDPSTEPPRSDVAERIEPSLGDTVPAPPPEVRPATPRRQARLDALIDAIVPMALDAPVTGESLLAHLPPTRRAGTKPFYIEGLDTETGEWEMPAPGHHYGELQAGVQLTNRSGALNEIEYSEFVQKVQAFAETVGAMPDFPDMLDVVARARELDAFASPLDAQLTITLRSDAVAWSVGYVQQCAGRHGFMPGTVAGRMVLPSTEDGAPPILMLSFDAQAALADDPQKASVREIHLSLDVAQTPAAAEPFPAWHNAARALGDDMAATAVDDFGEPITLHAFAGIGQELDQLYAKLESRDLAAGSPAARRLFSG